MKVTLNLKSPLWKREDRRRILDQAVQQSGAELEGEIKQKILTGPKTGRLYRKGPITAAKTKKLQAAGFKLKKGSSTRLVVGSFFHRASAPGQSPASDTGGLVNSIRAKKTGEMKTTVSSGKTYAAALDDGSRPPSIRRSRQSKKKPGPVQNLTGPHRGGMAPRPFFKSTASDYAPKFKENVRKAIASASENS